MNRDELAEAIYLSWVAIAEPTKESASIAYRYADAFIAERERQQEDKPLEVGERVVYCNPNGSLYLEKGTIHCITGTDLTTMHVNMDCGTRIHTSKDFLVRIVSESPAPEVEPETRPYEKDWCHTCFAGECKDCGCLKPTAYRSNGKEYPTKEPSNES